jgi:hypothetical protein
MKIDINKVGLWIIDHDGLIIGEQTLENAVIEYGEGMKERGRSEASPQQ